MCYNLMPLTECIPVDARAGVLYPPTSVRCHTAYFLERFIWEKIHNRDPQRWPAIVARVKSWRDEVPSNV